MGWGDRGAGVLGLVTSHGSIAGFDGLRELKKGTTFH